MISVIIPAHNESAVIRRTLMTMTAGAEPGELDVVVVCNGCSDDTATVAREFGSPVRVIETSIAGKPHALNLGDEAACGFPRVYADADVLVTPSVLRSLARRLEPGDVLAVAPTPSMDLAGCSWLVRAFYGIRSLLPSAREGIGGSGVYALSEAGRRRFESFPQVIADDGYVRIQFPSGERLTVKGVHSTVFPPRTIKALLATKTRAHQGSFELMEMFPQLWKNKGESNNDSLIGLFKDLRLWPKLAVYCLVTLAAKRQARQRLQRGAATWERDGTSRVPA